MWSSSSTTATAAENGKVGKKTKPPPQSNRRRSMLPTKNERKRMMQLTQAEKDRKSTAKVQSVLSRLNDVESFGHDENPDDIAHDEVAPLNDKRGGNPVGYGSAGTARDTDGKDESNNRTSGFFGQLFSSAKGTPALTPDSPPTVDDDEEQPPQQEDDIIMSVEEKAQSFRDRNQAFLKQTEAERKSIMQRNRRDELGSVVIPMVHKLTSLESIPSSSGLADLDEEEEDSSSDDDESEQSSSGLNGLPPQAKVSKRDRIMEQERLQEEEEEYRLRNLPDEKSESEKKLVNIIRGIAMAIVVAFLIWIIIAVS